MDDTVTLLKEYKTLLEAQQGGRPLTHFEVINELTKRGINYTVEGLKTAIEKLTATNKGLEESITPSSQKERTVSISYGERSNPTGSTTIGVLGGVGRHNAQRGNRAIRPTETQALAEVSERRG